MLNKTIERILDERVEDKVNVHREIIRGTNAIL